MVALTETKRFHQTATTTSIRGERRWIPFLAYRDMRWDGGFEAWINGEIERLDGPNMFLGMGG